VDGFTADGRECTPFCPPDGAVDQAIATLEKARDAIDTEVDAAKERADEAKAEYDALKVSAPDRKADIETKIEALKA